MTTRYLLCCSALVLLQSGASALVTAPVWAKPDDFWFRRSVPDGYVWMRVDAQYGVREPLFDHQRLAIEMSLKTGVEYTALTLPFADPGARFVVKYDGADAYIQAGARAIEFVLDRVQWRCELQLKWSWSKDPPTDYDCRAGRSIAATQPAVEAKADAAAAPVRSPDGRWEALVQNHNVAIRPVGGEVVHPTPLSSDGTAAFGYHAGSIRWSRDSKTLTAYRVHEQVWLSDSVSSDSVKDQVVKGDWTVPR